MSETAQELRGWLSRCVVLALVYAAAGGIVILLIGPGVHGVGIWLVASLSTGFLIHRLARRADQLDTQDHKIQTVLTHATVGILFADRDGKITLANPAASAIFELPGEQIEGCALRSLLPPGDVGEHAVLLAQSSEGGPPDPVMITTPSGSKRWIRLRADTGPQQVTTIIVTDITESVEATRRIAIAEHRWSSALEGSGIGVYETDLLTGRGIVSDTWLKLAGLSPDEPIDPEEEWLQRVHPDDLARVKQGDLDCIEGRIAHFTAEYRFQVVGRGWRWMRSDAKVVEWTSDGRAARLLGTMTDVTDLREAIDFARSREAELKALIEQSPVAKAVLSIDGRFELVNDAFCEFVGQPRASLEKARITEFSSPGAVLPSRRKFKDLMAGTISKFSTETRYVRPDGTERFGLVTATRLRGKPGQTSRIVGQIVDVTEARRLSQMRADFVATVSHELRTPLTSINGAIKGIVGTTWEELPEKTQRLLTVAARNCDRLGYLVNDLLDMQKLTCGSGTDFRFVHANITELVEQCLVDTRIYAEQYGVTFGPLEGADRIEAEVDADRFKQVMANLLSNAAKFSPRGEVVMTRVQRDNDVVVISIANQGPGIPQKFAERVFEPFTQVEDTNTRTREGSGLGLSIAKAIVERMQGEIGFTSTPGATTTFWVKLPVAKGAAQHAA